MKLVFGILLGAAALWAQPQPPPAPWRGAGAHTVRRLRWRHFQVRPGAPLIRRPRRAFV